MQASSVSSSKHPVAVVTQVPLIGLGVKQLLEPSKEFSWIASLPDLQNLIDVVDEIRPDLLLLDMTSNDFAGSEAKIEALRKQIPSLSILLLLSQSRSPEVRMACCSKQIQGAILATQPPEKILIALKLLRKQHSYFDPSLELELGASHTGEEGASRRFHLSRREQQILKLIATGQKNREIAALLSISIKTVESHRLNLMRKLNAHHVVALVEWARALKLI